MDKKRVSKQFVEEYLEFAKREISCKDKDNIIFLLRMDLILEREWIGEGIDKRILKELKKICANVLYKTYLEHYDKVTVYNVIHNDR